MQALCTFKFQEVTKMLESARADALKDPSVTCLSFAIMARAPVAIVAQMLAKGANVNMCLSDNMTPLHYAANFCEAEPVVTRRPSRPARDRQAPARPRARP